MSSLAKPQAVGTTPLPADGGVRASDGGGICATSHGAAAGVGGAGGGAWSDDPAAADAIRRMRRVSPGADPVGRLPDVHPARIPRHVAIIMDGNGRWAKARGLPRGAGHLQGASTVRRIVEESGALGIECLTLFSFSMENWKRPEDEVRALMQLYVMQVKTEGPRLIAENIRFRQIGRREGLPREVIEACDWLTSATSGNTGPTLCLAVNYGSRAEIADAAREIARRAARGEIDPESIDEAAVSAALYAPDLPEPDLLIRTAGEVRVSNFLLWQISYAELHVSRSLWPDFSVADLHAAVRDYAARSRRFGGLDLPPA